MSMSPPPRRTGRKRPLPSTLAEARAQGYTQTEIEAYLARNPEVAARVAAEREAERARRGWRADGRE